MEEQPPDDAISQLHYLIKELRAVMDRLVPTTPAAEATHTEEAKAANGPPALAPLNLSKRMRQFLKLLCHPKSYYYKEIAAIMGCHISTLRTYRERIFERYGIKGKPALMVWAFANGLA